MKTRTNRSFSAAVALIATLGLVACSGSEGATGPVDQGKSKALANSSQMVGPGCAAYVSKVPSGAGSVEGMAEDPLVTAAGNNPMLTQLTAALSGKLNSKVNLANSLNGREYTVFAPIDDAFKQLPATQVASLRTSQDALTKLLMYHVVDGQLAPNVVLGQQRTIEGRTVDVTGPVNGLKVNGANVICGGVRTANATVYLIDKVLTPPAG